MGSAAMDLNVDSLLREPELLARVFLFLDQKDLRSVEQVCHVWKELVERQSIWRRKLMQAKNTRTGWARAVNQMGLAVPSLGIRWSGMFRWFPYQPLPRQVAFIFTMLSTFRTNGPIILVVGTSF